MNWKEFLAKDLKKVMITSLLSVLFLAVNKTLNDMYGIIIFYSLSIFGLYCFFAIYGISFDFKEDTLEASKKLLAYSPLFVSILFYIFVYGFYFIFMFTLYGGISYLISCILSWIFRPELKKLDKIINVKIIKILWIALTIISIILFFFLSFAIGG